jgi:hypothetical protein
MTTKEYRIRKLVWYSRWEKFLAFLDKNPAPEEVMMYVHRLIDSLNGYGSATMSGSSKKCVDLLTRVRKETKEAK